MGRLFSGVFCEFRQMSQIPLIQIPLKLTDEVDFKDPFSQYIESQYSEDPSKYQTEISLLSKLRQDIAGAGTDLPGRDILYRYYGQLELLDLRFPIDEKNVNNIINNRVV